jgi:hypothetical protein
VEFPALLIKGLLTRVKLPSYAPNFNGGVVDLWDIGIAIGLNKNPRDGLSLMGVIIGSIRMTLGIIFLIHVALFGIF